MKRDLEYENNNIGFSAQYTEETGGGIKCKNYELCKRLLPKWWFDKYGNYFCSQCHMVCGTQESPKWNLKFIPWLRPRPGPAGQYIIKPGKGMLEFYDNRECPVCLEKKRSILQPRCEHTLCIECFKRCYWGYNDSDIENEPQFPYPDIEKEYYKDPENLKWNNDYPLIKKYNEDRNKHDDAIIFRISNQDYLQTCPLCRK